MLWCAQTVIDSTAANLEHNKQTAGIKLKILSAL